MEPKIPNMRIHSLTGDYSEYPIIIPDPPMGKSNFMPLLCELLPNPEHMSLEAAYAELRAMEKCVSRPLTRAEEQRKYALWRRVYD